MAKLFKLPLISFIACALTIGGIFGAWTFSGGGSASVDSNLTAGTTPTDYWQFNSVSFKFVCDNANNNPTLTGEFSDSSTTKTISVHEDAGLTYEQYSEIDKPECSTPGYVFSHWAYYKEGKLTHYNLDVGFSTNVTLYAQYVDATNPAIYLYTSAGFALQSYMFVNPGNTKEYMANNLLVSENPGTRNSNGLEGRDKYVVKKKTKDVPEPVDPSDPDIFELADSDIVWIDDESSNDKVVKGLYNVFYSDTASTSSDWKTFGGHCWFQRQYSLSLFGNPTQGWKPNPRINAPLGFVSEINNDPTEEYSDIKTTTYKATKVAFTDAPWLEGNTNYEFKPGDRYFDDISYGYPKEGISTYENNYIEVQTSGDYNYELKESEQRNNMFDITIEVTYKKYASDRDPAQYRNFILCSARIVEVVPYNYTINYYDAENKEELIGTESVAYGSNASIFLSDDLNHREDSVVGGTMYFATTWVDKYTGQQFDIDTLKEKEITQNLNLYPLYDVEGLDPITINYKTYNGSWEISQKAYVYNCNPSYTSYYKANVTPTASTYDEYTYKSKWQLKLTLEGEQYDPSDIADFDYEFVNDNDLTFVNGLTGGKELNVFARYERMGTYLKVADNDPINLTGLDDKIVFDNIGSSSDKYSFGTDNLLGESGDILYAYGEENTIGNTGTTGFNLCNGDINVVNFRGKTVPTMKNSSTETITDKVFLQPNANWLADNAYFAACFTDATAQGHSPDEICVRMTDTDGDGVFECAKYDKQNVIFCRFNYGDEMISSKAVAWTLTQNLTGTNRKCILNAGVSGKGSVDWNCSWTTMTVTSTSQIIYDAIYLKPNGWNVDGARYAAYFFHDGKPEVWYDMAQIGTTGIYVGAVPSGYTNVIFCRMNGGTTANNWNNRWNQTYNLTTPTSDVNMYIIGNYVGGTVYSVGEWSTY